MELRKFFKRHQAPAAIASAPAVTATPQPEPMTPQQQADLEAARVELREAMEESQVTSFRACSRNGRHWWRVVV